MNLTMVNLENCFNTAYEKRCPFVAVKVKMQGFEKPEIIINQLKNVKEKLAYYQRAYNDDLTLKANPGIKITGFSYGDSFKDIEDDLLWQ